MKTIAAEQFKDQCLALLDHVDPDGIVLTKSGKPVARLLPIVSPNQALTGRELIGALKGKFAIRGDVLSTGISWDAES